MKNKIFKKNNLNSCFAFLVFGLFTISTLMGQDKLPIDPGIRYGKLPNGLTYYLKPTKDSLSEMNAYLLVKAGIANVDPDQYELEHFLEHIVMKAGKNMNRDEAMDLGFGMADIQANPSFYFTQYYFTSINTFKKRNVALRLFHDIIWDIDFKDKYIDNERPVLINEMAIRKKNSAMSIMIDLENTMIGRGAPRPKDIADYLNTFPVNSLKRFYKDWYRPDLMAIVIIGDIRNVDELENEIITKFSKSKPIHNPRFITKDYSEYKNSSPQFIKLKNPYESKEQSVYLNLYLREKESPNQYGAQVLKDELYRGLLIKVLNDRYEAKQAFYGVHYNVFPEFVLPHTLGLKLKIIIKSGKERAAFLQIMQVLKELKTNGLSESEFKKSKNDYLLGLSQIDTTKSNYWWTNIRSHFVNDEPLPTQKNELLKSILTNLGLNNFNCFIKKTINTQPNDLDIIMLAPQGHQALSYSEETIRWWIKEANHMDVEAYSPPKIPDGLISRETMQNLKLSSVQKKSSGIPGVTEYHLENGVKLVLNPLNIPSGAKANRNNNISIQGFTPKGVGCYSKADYFSALNAVDIIKNSGVGGLDKFELNRYLREKGFEGKIFPYIKYDESGIKGVSSLENLETALKLIYLYFTSPNKEQMAFEDWKTNVNTSFSILNKINRHDFKTKIKKALGDSTFLPQGSSVLKGISKTDLDRAYEIYQNIYNNAEDFTFILTGDYSIDKVLTLCRKYLGNLPSLKSAKECALPRSSSKFLLPKSHSKIFASTENMQEVLVELVYTSKISSHWNWKKEVELLFLRKLLDNKISQLRFESGAASYFMGVGINIDKSRLFNEVFVTFSCSKDDAKDLIMQCEQVIKSFSKKKIDEESWEKNLNYMIRYWEKKKNSPAFKLENLYNNYRQDYPYLNIEEIQSYLNSLTPEYIQQTAKQLLHKKPFEFVMMNDENNIDL